MNYKSLVRTSRALAVRIHDSNPELMYLRIFSQYIIYLSCQHPKIADRIRSQLSESQNLEVIMQVRQRKKIQYLEVGRNYNLAIFITMMAYIYKCVYLPNHGDEGLSLPMGPCEFLGSKFFPQKVCLGTLLFSFCRNYD